MCIPLAAIAIATTLAGAAASAAGSIYSGMAQSAAYKAQAKAKAYEAQGEREAGAFASARQGERNDRLTGQQVTAAARSGSDLFGTPLSVIGDARTEGELDKMAIRYNSTFRSNLSLYESKVAKMNASTAKTGGYIGAIAPALSGITSSFDTYQRSKG
jgi:hypothetical protein